MLDLGTTFDVIICAGVLCYITESEACIVSNRLARHLAHDGVLVVQNSPELRYWDEYLKRYFVRLDEVHLPDGWGYVAVFAV